MASVNVGGIGRRRVRVAVDRPRARDLARGARALRSPDQRRDCSANEGDEQRVTVCRYNDGLRGAETRFTHRSRPHLDRGCFTLRAISCPLNARGAYVGDPFTNTANGASGRILRNAACRRHECCPHSECRHLLWQLDGILAGLSNKRKIHCPAALQPSQIVLPYTKLPSAISRNGSNATEPFNDSSDFVCCCPKSDHTRLGSR
jgi:hypothetical protein